MANQTPYRPEYDSSHALVVGINTYAHVSPLSCAVNDATGVANILKSKYGFPESHVTLLSDGQATKANILRAFLKFADGGTGPDDRILFFFAGHGHTVGGRRETGFLIPQDGKLDDLSTFIRWDEFTRDADLIAAKHILFLMDACYGGLAVHRKAAPIGSKRFISDLMQRFARQVLAAGKPDQPVSDGGGTRSGHSLFTSHLLDGLEGAAASGYGLITGNSLMSYVYQKVGADQYSQQTPHYGSFDGDGDFVFNPNVVASSGNQEEKDSGVGGQVLVEVPALPEGEPSEVQTLGRMIKALIPRPDDRIKFDDTINGILRNTISELRVSNFPVQQGQGAASESFALRINRYDQAILDIETVAVLIAHWGDQSQRQLLGKILTRLAEAERPTGGLVVWLHLTAYPVLATMYAAGIAALAADRYDMLYTALLTPVRWSRSLNGELLPIVVPIAREVTEIFDNFKTLPGYERKYVPRSEHLLVTLQPIIEDLLFLGRGYEELFDQFEIMLALVYADQKPGFTSRFWGPPGRFAYKERSFLGEGKPFTGFVNAVLKQGQNWPGFSAGFFNGSLDRFKEVAQGYAELIEKAGPVF